MSKRRITALFITFDLVSAVLSWLIFYLYRVVYIEETGIIFKGSFYQNIILVPAFWMILYTLQGTYIGTVRMHRLKSIKITLYASILGVIFIFFATLLNDVVMDYRQFYSLFLILFGLHFLITVLPRLIITTIHVKRIHKGVFGFNTIILGGSDKAVKFLDDIKDLKQSSGHILKGFVNINGSDFKIKDELELLGSLDEIEELVEKYEIEEVIIALETSDHEKLKDIISRLAVSDVRINLIPDSYDILSGQVQMSSIFGALLLKVNTGGIPNWQIACKRALDICLSLFAIILSTPLYIILSIAVLTSSKGPIFFRQERIGLYGKPFRIFKFRTMVVGAEKSGPQLSSSTDSRVTKVGRFLRKTRLDEFPQFFNVLKGDMSLVGPRPERQYYIDQIIKEDPQYLYLHKVRPGITSWGQVKFGYAENVEQMLERMKYDLLYLRNMSLALDFKIMFYTILIVFKGTGK